MSKTFNKNIPYTFTGSILLPTSSNLNITSNSNTIGNIFTTGGNVGIGITNPSARLEVNGNFEATGSLHTVGSIIVSGGNVGIGTTAPASILDVVSSSPLLQLRSSAGLDGKIYFGNSSHGVGRNASIGTLTNVNDVILWTNGAGSVGFATSLIERMRITSSGNVGIGTNTPEQKLSVNGTIQGATSGSAMVFGGSAGSSLQSFGTNNRDVRLTSWGGFGLTVAQNSGNIGIGTTSPIYSLDIYGNQRLYTANGVQMSLSTSNGNFATIEAFTAGNTAKLPLCLNPYGGNVGVGTTNPVYKLDNIGAIRTRQLAVGANAPFLGGGGWLSYMTSNLTDGENSLALQACVDTNYILGFYNTAGVFRGVISGVNASSVAYITTSDRRRKTNIQDMDSMIYKIKQLKPRTFKWIEDNQKDDGFIAQEVHTVFPQFRSGVQSYCDNCGLDYSDLYDGKTCNCFDFENPLDKNGNPYYYGLDYGKLTPYLTKALQETIYELETAQQTIQQQQETINKLVTFIQNKFPGELNL